MEKEKVLAKEVRIDIIVSLILRNWKTYIKPMAATFAVTVAIVLCIPRSYTVQVKLVPEYGNGGSDLAGMASMVGINLGNVSSSDAIVPLYYPDLVGSTRFCIPLLDVDVECADTDFKGTYMEYLKTQTKDTPWGKAIKTVRRWFKSKDKGKGSDDGIISPFRLSKPEYDLYKAVSGSIKCSFDKKNDVITLSTTAQDPLVATLMADSVMQHLQDFIVEYRTHKVRLDCEHYQSLVEEKEALYRQALGEYGQFADANTDLRRPSMVQRSIELQNAMQNAYDEYIMAGKQLTLSRAKLTERTPAFTVIENATVPIRPTSPKRMIIVAGMLFLCFVGKTAHLIANRE